jgi:hypothetical protein
VNSSFKTFLSKKIFSIKKLLRGGGIKEYDEGDEFKYDMRILVNVTMYPQYNNKKRF